MRCFEWLLSGLAGEKELGRLPLGIETSLGLQLRGRWCSIKPLNCGYNSPTPAYWTMPVILKTFSAWVTGAIATAVNSGHWPHTYLAISRDYIHTVSYQVVRLIDIDLRRRLRPDCTSYCNSNTSLTTGRDVCTQWEERLCAASSDINLHHPEPK